MIRGPYATDGARSQKHFFYPGNKFLRISIHSHLTSAFCGDTFLFGLRAQFAKKPPLLSN
jgi:hypothetical protein